MGGLNTGGVCVYMDDSIFGQDGGRLCDLCGRVAIRNQIFDRVWWKFAPVLSGKFECEKSSDYVSGNCPRD